MITSKFRGLDGDTRIGLEQHDGWEASFKFGRNIAVGASQEDIWSPGTAYPWGTAPEAVRVASGGNANDTAAGTGIRSVTIQGLDENWRLAEETVDTAGSSASTSTTTTFNRVFRVFGATCGTYGGVSADDIVIEGVSSSNALAYIDSGEDETHMSHYTVPLGY